MGLFFLAIPNNYRHTFVRKTSAELIIPTYALVVDQSPSNKNKININNATIADLVSLPGLGEMKAAAIVEFREKYGPFEEINELTYVPGIGVNLVNSIQDMVIIDTD